MAKANQLKKAFATLEYKDGNVKVVTTLANHGIKKNGVEYDSKNGVIHVHLETKPAAHPTVVATSGVTPVMGNDFDHIKLIVPKTTFVETEQIGFVAEYY